MLEIELKDLGKKFRKEWIFRNLNITLKAGQTYAVIGPNGSGKSTLMQVISCMMPANEGIIQYIDNQMIIDGDDCYKEVVFAAPYLELIEEFTLEESIDFHRKLKPFENDISNETFLDFTYLKPHRDKSVKNFSSGMKQRLKLGLALQSEARVLILDEPSSNLDEQGFDWYKINVQKHLANKITLIGSNIQREYDFCQNKIQLGDLKRGGKNYFL